MELDEPMEHIDSSAYPEESNVQVTGSPQMFLNPAFTSPSLNQSQTSPAPSVCLQNVWSLTPATIVSTVEEQSSTATTTTNPFSTPPAQSSTPHSLRITMAEFNEQSQSYTQQALRDLKASPEYKKHTMKCHSCGASWYDGQWTQGCTECGGYAMHQPCPICHGNCGEMWGRNVDMSHSMHEAHWDGKCGHQNQAYLIRDMLHMNNLTDAMDELQTGT